MDKGYELRYLPLFYEDLSGVVDYIADQLDNPKAAYELLDQVELAIHDRLSCPEAFEPYRSRKKRKETYYRIYVENYVIYYVVIDRIMEVRRILYGKRDTDRML